MTTRRMGMLAATLALAGLATVPGPATAAAAPSAAITVTELSGLARPFTPTQLNERGQVLGHADLDQGGPQWFRYENGRFRSLTPAANDNVSYGVTGMNANGDVAGDAFYLLYFTPFLRTATGFTALNGVKPALVTAISDKRQVVMYDETGTVLWDRGRRISPATTPEGTVFVGEAISGTGDLVGGRLQHAQDTGDGYFGPAVWSPGGAVIPLGTPIGYGRVQAITRSGTALVDNLGDCWVWDRARGLVHLVLPAPSGGVGTNGWCGAINELGHVVVTGPHATYLWRDGVFTTIETTDPDERLYPVDLNDRDQIVIERLNIEHPDGRKAMLWDNGQLTDLDALAGGARDTRPIAINNRGDIVGVRESLDDRVSHALLWHLPPA